MVEHPLNQPAVPRSQVLVDGRIICPVRDLLRVRTNGPPEVTDATIEIADDFPWCWVRTVKQHGQAAGERLDVDAKAISEPLPDQLGPSPFAPNHGKGAVRGRCVTASPSYASRLRHDSPTRRASRTRTTATGRDGIRPSSSRSANCSSVKFDVTMVTRPSSCLASSTSSSFDDP